MNGSKAAKVDPALAEAARFVSGKARRALSPQDMLIFAAVAREGGIRRGALALDMPRSTVSRQLAALERTLEARLVSRSTRRFALTEMGQRLLVQCSRLEDVLKTTERVLTSAAREPSGTLTITASPIMGEELLPKVVADYMGKFPRVRVDIRLSLSFVDLRRAGVDLAVRTGPIEDAGDLFSTRLGTSPKGFYASPAYLKRHGVPSAPEDLAKHDCILIGAGKTSDTWELRSRGDDVHVVVSGALRVDSYRLARDCAAVGLGVARMPSFFAEGLVGEGKLVPLLEKDWPKTTLYAVHAAGRPAPPKIRAFVAILREALKQNLG